MLSPTETIEEENVINPDFVKNRRYIAWFDKDHEGGPTLEYADFKKFSEGYGYPNEELFNICRLGVGESVHFISHPMINTAHHIITRITDKGED